MSYKIVHLTDLHITSRDDDPRYEVSLPHQKLKGMNQAFKALLATQYLKSADHIIVTGDITDKGDARAWKKFWGYLATAGLDEKTSFVIGNHDICELGKIKPYLTKKRKFQNAKKAQRLLKRRLTSIGQSYAYPWAKMLREDIVLFGIDSNNAGNLSDASNALGFIGQRQLRAFARLLRAHKDIPVKIVALHHSPNLAESAKRVRDKSWFEKKYTRYTHQIPEAERRSLRLLCESHGVKRLIHGHMHEFDDRTLNVRITGAPSSTQPEKSEDGSTLRFIEYHVTSSKAGSYRVSNQLRSVPYTSEQEDLSFWEWLRKYLNLG